ncbi:hypothetical protein AQUCO_00200162v1 [Aquilegia coerulea]|uniref:Uncharacterized protein n=1 Tax=Aquilegia coerulea TaxID=218851 RepID=A0A2G5F1S4_AQUCA|nr:hypothetical protein AQUCO_00200162v1 [Aquilegia coerulea]
MPSEDFEILAACCPRKSRPGHAQEIYIACLSEYLYLVYEIIPEVMQSDCQMQSKFLVSSTLLQSSDCCLCM